MRRFGGRASHRWGESEGACETIGDDSINGVEYGSPIREAYFGLLRVHVDIDQCWIDVYVDHAHRVTSRFEYTAVSLGHDTSEYAVSNHTVVDDRSEGGGSCAGFLRRCQERLDTDRATLGGDGGELVVGVQRQDSLSSVVDLEPLAGFLAVTDQHEGFVG